MRLFQITALTLLALTLSACTQQLYRVNGKTYTDRKEAEAADQASRAAILAGITPRSSPVAALGRIVMPSKALIAGRLLGEGGSVEAKDFVATAVYAGMRDLTEAIRKRNIFERLEVEETSDGDAVKPKPGEVVIYYFKPDKTTGGWNYISTSTKRTPLHFDEANPDKVAKVMYLIDHIEGLAAAEPK